MGGVAACFWSITSPNLPDMGLPLGPQPSFPLLSNSKSSKTWQGLGRQEVYDQFFHPAHALQE